MRHFSDFDLIRKNVECCLELHFHFSHALCVVSDKITIKNMWFEVIKCEKV